MHILGTVQHFKAEKSLESLKALSSPSAKVMRNGVKVEVPSKEIVPGDILLLEAGDLVVADGRIIENYSLQVNESSLTGESEGVNKISAVIDEENVALGDQKNMVLLRLAGHLRSCKCCRYGNRYEDRNR